MIRTKCSVCRLAIRVLSGKILPQHAVVVENGIVNPIESRQQQQQQKFLIAQTDTMSDM